MWCPVFLNVGLEKAENKMRTSVKIDMVQLLQVQRRPKCYKL
jgi:hypothetical protein